jgi:hypothetical protein
VNALVFLGIAVGLSLIGCLVLWLRSRQPGSMDAHIRDFARELDALAPGSPLDRARGRGAPRNGGPADTPSARRDPEPPAGPPPAAPRRGPERPAGPGGGRRSG